MRFSVKFNSIDRRFNMGFQSVQVVSGKPDVEHYEGKYEVVPAVTAQQLETKQKFLTEDIKIREIPFFNVSNTSGGSTVYIGKEVD